MSTPRKHKIVKIIHFVDNGQDFLHWGLDRQGHVRTCDPPTSFDEYLGRKVLNHDTLQAGEKAYMRVRRGIYVRTAAISHAVREVEIVA